MARDTAAASCSQHSGFFGFRHYDLDTDAGGHLYGCIVAVVVSGRRKWLLLIIDTYTRVSRYDQGYYCCASGCEEMDPQNVSFLFALASSGGEQPSLNLRPPFTIVPANTTVGISRTISMLLVLSASEIGHRERGFKQLCKNLPSPRR